MSISLSAIEAGEDHFDFSESEISFDEPEAPAPEPVYVESESEEPEDEQKLIRKRLITKMYLNEFPEKLKSYQRTKNKIDSMGLEELELLRKEFEMTIGMKTTVAGMAGTMMSAIGMLETTLLAFTPIDPSGLTQICAADNEFQDDLKLISLKYAESFNSRPEARLAFGLTRNIFLLHKMNTAQKAAPPVIQPEQADNMAEVNLNNLFGDL